MNAPFDVELVAEQAQVLAAMTGMEHMLFDRDSGLEVFAVPGAPAVVWQPDAREHADLSWYTDMVAATPVARPVSWMADLFARLRHPSAGA